MADLLTSPNQFENRLRSKHVATMAGACCYWRCWSHYVADGWVSVDQPLWLCPEKHSLIWLCKYNFMSPKTEQLSGVVQKMAYWVYLTQRSPGCFIRRLSICTHVFHREGNSVGEPPLFNVAIWNGRVLRETKFFEWTGDRTKNPGSRFSMLSSKSLLHPVYIVVRTISGNLSIDLHNYHLDS